MREDDPTAYNNVLPELANVYLEDSYVLGLTATADSLVFDVDLVLTPQHPEYRDPRPNEVHCFRRARIALHHAGAIRWARIKMRSFTDATGEIDFGCIDVWSVNGSVSHIEGDWGEVEVQGGNVTVVVQAPQGRLT